MIWNNVPQELKDRGLWCCWKLVPPRGKIPYNALTGQLAKSNDKTTFHSFLEVMQRISTYYKFDENQKMIGGLGLGIFNGFSAVDIDHCRNIEDGTVTEMAQDIIDFCQSYTEISPSGTGIRIVFKTSTKLDKEVYYINNSKIGLEIYLSDQTNKFVTITGNSLYLSDLKEIDIQYILEKYMRKNQMEIPEEKQTIQPETITDGKFDMTKFEKALGKDDKLIQLWNTVAPGSGSNESELDLALCSKLAFYLNRNIEAIKTVFMSSPYYSTKDEKHKKKWLETAYSQNTMMKAINSQIKVFEYGGYGLNDTGNAHRFADKFKEIVKYNIDNKRWMSWNGNYWQYDVFNNVKNLAELVIEEMKLQAKSIESEDAKKAMLTNIKKAYSSAGKEAMLKESMHLPDMPVTNEIFDSDPFLFNCESGIVDLRTGKITPHDKSQLLSKYSPYPLSDKTPMKWLKFLNEIFDRDQELIKYVQKVFGYSMTGSTKEQCMFMLIGDGSNGKSILLQIINDAMGSYGAASNIEVILEQKNSSGSNLGEVARLNRIRNVVTSETQIGDKLNESAIKTMTSGVEKIVARFLYGNEFEFIPIFKIFMATNHKPIIRGTDHGIWRRIRIIPFNVVFAGDKQDKDLLSKLRTEMPEIINWMIQGCLLWQKEGLANPTAIEDSLKEYRCEMDIVQKWIDESCELHPDYRTKGSELFNNLCVYISTNREFQISNTMFGRNIGKKFKKVIYNGVTFYKGIKIKEGLENKIDMKKYDQI